MANAETVDAGSPPKQENGKRRRGRLKVYLGASPGCGKTFAMLREGRDRRQDGEDVVVGFVETHGRTRTADAVGTLEVLPRIRVAHRGVAIEEMDVDAVIARHPQVALIDELAHTNAPGLHHIKRWQDVEDIRASGIDVISTMNVQHLESVKDLVEGITGVRVAETVPDAALDAADEVQFIDITPEALRKRMTHGNVYPLDRVPTALDNFFRSGNLAALREIGLRLVAERVGSERGGVQAAPEDVVVAVSAHATAEPLVRRAARLARRHGGTCTVVHVHERHAQGADDDALRALAAELQCALVERDHGDVAAVVEHEVRTRGAQHLLVGEPAPARFPASLRRSPVDRLLERLTSVDVHVAARHGVRDAGKIERADPERLLRGLGTSVRAAGALRLYIGYAPGVGTTTAMLDEARRRAGRGTDVVVAALDPARADLLKGLAVVGRRGRTAAGRLDVAALLARNPDVAAVDDLTAPTTTGQLVADAVPAIRAAGITVIGTVRTGDIESTVAAMGRLLTRSPDDPVVGDAAVDAADELELVDVVPTELEDRLRDGAIMPPRAAAYALQGTYRRDVLDSLRELTFRRVAQHQDRRLLGYMASKRIAAPWEARPRLLVCVPPRPGQEELVLRAARFAARRDDALTAISVRRRGHLSDEEKSLLGSYAALTHGLGGEFVSVDGGDVAIAVAAFARRNRITEIIAMRGAGRRRSRTLRRLVQLLADVDVHVLASLR